MNRLQMAPSHNGNAGRPFPLPKLGRRELATWWWQSCTCWGKKNRVVCSNCRRLARSVSCLSKTTWRINQEGKLTVTAKKNRHLLWWNGTQMMKTSLQLQAGDIISVGNSAETPWLEFYVKKLKAVVTPETDVAKMPSPLSTSAKARQTVRTNSKSRRRLFSGHYRDGYRSEESSLDETDNSHVFSNMHETQMENAYAVMTPRNADSGDESQNTCNLATKHNTRQERNAVSTRRKLLLSQEENRSLPATTVIEETHHKQTQPVDNHHAESQESSILSLPQCPTWEDESQTIVGTNSIDSSANVKRPCSHEEARLYQQPWNESKTTPEESSQGSNVLFASTLSLSQWKHIKQTNDGAARIRGAFASLVVAQRVRDPMWFPAILEGAVLEGDVMEDANES